MADIHDILKHHWGYSHFRPLQEDIILSVLEGRDTLALLPTGGGKSICFQVPALARDGMCVVVSPLIALMKDQVENLIERGIPALAIFSGMSRRQMDLELDNCIHGKYRFLYVSPERLQAELFQVRLQQMKVNLLAIDEAHCISQWGYDFRPEYLQIAAIRQRIQAPVLALTATATPEVTEDIQERLLFPEKRVFRKSFERRNLSYIVLREENKLERLLEICKKIKGTGVIYARNRKLCRDIAEYLSRNGQSADHYHAGLDQNTRNRKQEAWIKNKVRIIVSTNAFGMGIDKPDVRFVLHYEMPDSLEAYYQEAGRAGRDENKAWCVALINDRDRSGAYEKLEKSYPGYEEVERVYEHLCNHYQVAVNSGEMREVDFDLAAFSNRAGIAPSLAFHALSVLEKQDILRLSEGFHQPSQVHLMVDNTTLYDFELRNPKVASFLKLMLRSYGGLFENYVRIDENHLARNLGVHAAEVVRLLERLKEAQLLDYVPARNGPSLTFIRPRERKLSYDQKAVQRRKEVAAKRLESVFEYALREDECRSRMLLHYFGEHKAPRCGSCDQCLEDKKRTLSEEEYRLRIKELLAQGKLELKKMVSDMGYWHEEGLQQALQHMLDERVIVLNDKQEVEWKGRG